MCLFKMQAGLFSGASVVCWMDSRAASDNTFLP